MTTTDYAPTNHFIEAIEYRGSTLYLWRRPEQSVPYQREILSRRESPDPKTGRWYEVTGYEDLVAHYDEVFFVVFKDDPERYSHDHAGYHQGTRDKALKSAKHAVDVRRADEALQEPCIALIALIRFVGASSLPVATPQTTVNSVAWIYSRGGWRRGLVEKVGRTNVTVAYTTEGSLTEKNRFGLKQVTITRKSAKFDQVLVEKLA